MRFDSCRQCTKRRIKCDKGTPRCSKCIKKGIECSGVGKTYHFVQNITPSTVETSLSEKYRPTESRQGETQVLDAASSAASSSSLPLQSEDNDGFAADLDDAIEDVVPSSSGADQLVNANGLQYQVQRNNLHTASTPHYEYRLNYPLGIYKPGQLMLLDHCKLPFSFLCGLNCVRFLYPDG